MVSRKVIFWLGLAVLLGTAVPVYWRVFGPRDLAALEASYRLPNSQFADIDGIRVHYIEDGAKDAPCLILLHGAYMNLRVWDGLAQALSPHLHLIRMDLLASGLTGPDPTNAYTVDRDMQIVDDLTRRVGASTCDVLGTSTGGIVAYHYAAAHPERVPRLILIDSAGAPGVADREPRSDGWLGDWIEAHARFEAYWTDWLYDRLGAFPPTPELRRMVYDFNRRRGLAAELAQLEPNFVADAEHVLPQVTQPALLLWGTSDPDAPHVDAEVFAHWLTAAPSTIRKYPHLGAFPYFETPEAVAADILAFLDGKLDSELRITRRVPASAQHTTAGLN